MSEPLGSGYKKPVDPVYLFLRCDERVAAMEADAKDLRIAAEHLTNGLKAVEERMNLGVAITGQNNAKAIIELRERLAAMEPKLDRLHDEINGPETGIFKQMKEVKELLGEIRRGFLTVIFSGLIVSILLYALRFFKFS